MTDQLLMPRLSEPVRAPGFWRGLGIIATLELRQRLRARTLWVLAVVWFGIIGLVTAAMWATLSLSSTNSGSDFDAYPLFSIIVYFVLLFGTLVAPAISAGSISSERSGGTLATTQVTLVSSWSILLGKACAAWVTGLAFLVVASPFVVLSLALARTDGWQLVIAILALALQIGFFTLCGVGLSALISSPLFAIVTAYLLVALLSLGSLIAFGLGVGVTTRYVDVEYRMLSQEYWDANAACYENGLDDDAVQQCIEQVPLDCVTESMSTGVSATDRLWWLLAVNPYVIVGDMVSTRAHAIDGTGNLFHEISRAVRTLQHDPAAPIAWGDCPIGAAQPGTASTPDPLEGTIPVWWVGIALEVLVAAGLLWAGHHRLRTPAAALPKGARVA